jgi:hypothetical protein
MIWPLDACMQAIYWQVYGTASADGRVRHGK